MGRRPLNPPQKPQSLLVAEQEARDMLQAYFGKHMGVQVELARKTGLFPSQLSRMARLENHPISIEAAMRIEVGSNGELPAKKLCPAGADLIAQFVAMQMVKSKVSA
jgi:DNA-binding transcriptional regulator YdaS (Cro superfamily)